MINFFGSDPLLVLGQLGYTFLLGIILAILSLTYETPYLPILGHSLFNLLNLTLFTAFFSLDTDLPYYLYSGFLGIFFVGYAFLLYNLPKKKTEA
jgi:Ca2+/Na+ antiporter